MTTGNQRSFGFLDTPKGGGGLTGLREAGKWHRLCPPQECGAHKVTAALLWVSYTQSVRGAGSEVLLQGRATEGFC